MSLIFQRFPGARAWAWSTGQAAALLGCHVLLRVAVS